MVSETVPVSIHLDVQRGTVRTSTGAVFHVTPREMILLYWLALEAPEERIGRAIELNDRATVTPLINALREKLGLGDSVPKLSLNNGWAPASAWPWPERTALTIIRKGLERSDEAPMIYVADEGALTAREVSGLVARIGAGLRREGVTKGSRVAVDATQRLEAFLVTLATLLIGGVVVRLGDSVGPATLHHMIRAVPSVMTFSARVGQMGALAETGKRISFAGTEEVPEFSEWAAACPEPSEGSEPGVTVSPSYPALIGFTSGSTGTPKPILTSHETLFRSTEVATKLFKLGPDDIFCTATDFTALGGFRSTFGLPFLCGGRLVLPTEAARRQPLALALICGSYGVTRLTAVPNVLRGFVKGGDRLSADCLSDLCLVFSGTGILDRMTADGLRDRFGVPVIDYYAATEIGNAAYSDPHVPDTMSSGGGWASEVLIRVLNQDGTTCAVGATGEVCVHTDNLMIGYLGPVDDGVAVRDGWYWTGDLGRAHADGRVEIVGRRRDIVKTQDGGLVSPVEIENVLYTSEAVREACVFGCLGADGIERLGAAVILSEYCQYHERKAIETRLKTKVLDDLGPYKVPTHIVFRDNFPRVARGKPDKQTLCQEFEALFR